MQQKLASRDDFGYRKKNMESRGDDQSQGDFVLVRRKSKPRVGGTPLYKLYRYVPPQRAWFSSRFGLKTGIDFDHYGLKSGMVYKGTTGAYKRICLFNSK